MLHDWSVIATAFGYIGFLFLVAIHGDRLAPTQRRRRTAVIASLSRAPPFTHTPRLPSCALRSPPCPPEPTTAVILSPSPRSRVNSAKDPPCCEGTTQAGPSVAALPQDDSTICHP